MFENRKLLPGKPFIRRNAFFLILPLLLSLVYQTCVLNLSFESEYLDTVSMESSAFDNSAVAVTERLISYETPLGSVRHVKNRFIFGISVFLRDEQFYLTSLCDEAARCSDASYQSPPRHTLSTVLRI